MEHLFNLLKHKDYSISTPDELNELIEVINVYSKQLNKDINININSQVELDLALFLLKKYEEKI